MAERERKNPHLSGEPMDAKDYETATEAVESEFEVSGRVLKPKVVEFRCGSAVDVKPKFDGLLESLDETRYVPFMSEEEGELIVRVAKGEGVEGEGQRVFTRKHLFLLLATIVTTLWIGASLLGVRPLSNPLDIWKGWPYTVAIMGVLGVHEMGHFVMSKMRGVVATPPYFIPVPFALGTLGAVIRMKSPMPDRRSMFDIGVAGPLLGLAAAVPVTVVGLLSTPLHLPSGALAEGFRLGEPLIYRALMWMVSPDKGLLHPVAFAGWVGFFVTFLNLLPVGQLDGGHIARSLLGDLHAPISGLVPIALLNMGLLLTFFLGANGTVWIVWGFLTLLFHSAGHPPPLNDVTPLGPKRKLIGYLTFALMFACFVPVPFHMP